MLAIIQYSFLSKTVKIKYTSYNFGSSLYGCETWYLTLREEYQSEGV
jgi:hypothetical protein